MEKIVLIVTKSYSVLTFRKDLIHTLKNEGKEVIIIASDNEHEKEIVEMGVKFYYVKQDNRGLNPFSMFTYKNKIKKILKEEKPDTVFTFMLKPNTFGVLASKNAKIKNIYSMVEGAGDVFIKNSLSWKIIRTVVVFLYKKAFSKAKKVFFLNTDDQNEFVKRKIVKKEKCVLINGIGVNLERFNYRPIKNTNVFLMVSRMLNTKGVIEYCECARRVKKSYPDAQFNYLGGEGTLKISNIQEYIDDGSINYLGVTEDVRPYLEDCSVMVLPSYREGFPMSIMEAEAIGRGIITFDTIGCKETVKDGYNGYLVEYKNVEELIDRCKIVLENTNLVYEFGKNARQFAVDFFDSEKINNSILKVIYGEKNE